MPAPGSFEHKWQTLDPEGHARAAAREEGFFEKLLGRQREENSTDAVDWLRHEADRLLALQQAGQDGDPGYIGMEIIAKASALREAADELAQLRELKRRARFDQLMDLVAPFKPTHRHRKTGGLYRLLKHAFLEPDRTTVMAVYENTRGNVFVRPAIEFHDGHFEDVREPSEQAATELERRSA